MSDGGDCRTVPATAGLLKHVGFLICLLGLHPPLLPLKFMSYKIIICQKKIYLGVHKNAEILLDDYFVYINHNFDNASGSHFNQ